MWRRKRATISSVSCAVGAISAEAIEASRHPKYSEYLMEPVTSTSTPYSSRKDERAAQRQLAAD
jgi:hypothetical protein